MEQRSFFMTIVMPMIVILAECLSQRGFGIIKVYLLLIEQDSTWIFVVL